MNFQQCLATTQQGRRCGNRGFPPDGMCRRHLSPSLRHAESLRSRAYELHMAAAKLQRLADELERGGTDE
jgi:hypothetical protein